MPNGRPPQVQGSCFVVMGFGKKTDFETGRTLDLNLTYNYIIKPAVTVAGLQCIRADEITHSGPIDVPMYEQLLKADVVIADLSTSNKNAYYELGVRHALKPYTTIVICEDGIKTFPFDVNHVAIRQYHHMGEGIDYGEVERFRKALTDAIVTIYSEDPRRRDSPVYTFLNNLTPPALAEALQAVAEAAAGSSPTASGGSIEAAAGKPAKRYSELIQDIDSAQKSGDFDEARSLLKVLRKKMKPNAPDVSEDPYVIQRLALVTYKAKQDTQEKEIAALREARDLLAGLGPDTSNDTETLGLWAAVHKRLWDTTGDATALDKAVRSSERGFYLRNDYYNGINLAFLLNVRAGHAAGIAGRASGPSAAVSERAAAISDFVKAVRVRQEVVGICDQWLASNHPTGDRANDEADIEYLKSKYWVVATKGEAFLGSGKAEEAEITYKDAYSFAPAGWMIDSTKEQRAKLEPLLADSPLRYIKVDGEPADAGR
jgi:hypothetical protein